MFNALIFKYDVCLSVCFNFKKLFHLAQVARGEQEAGSSKRELFPLSKGMQMGIAAVISVRSCGSKALGLASPSH